MMWRKETAMRDRQAAKWTNDYIDRACRDFSRAVVADDLRPAASIAIVTVLRLRARDFPSS
jgi:hypothetical protein